MKTRKTLLMVLSLVLVAVVSVAGTLAYLQDKTGPVTNTFTVGNVNIDLKESTYDPDNNSIDNNLVSGNTNDTYKLIPGRVSPKDPTVTVETGSEDCWIFVEVVETGNTLGEGKIVEWAAAEGWTLLEGKTGENDGVIYAYTTAAQEAGASVPFLADSKITINDEFTGLAENANPPQLVFYAYAVQAEGFANDAAAAWNETFGATTTVEP
jgi:predicted ribosomally synthesized peptide with SipW-like signal peptide